MRKNFYNLLMQCNMLTTLHTLLTKAEKGRYAIPAFNVTNLETTQAVLDAAVQMKSPVIIQTSEAAIEYAGHETLFALMCAAIEERAASIPVVIHLDHGKHFDIVKDCIQLGYSSVHMDASEQSWRENVALTKRAVTLGHKKGITVQGELGYLLGYEGMTAVHFTKQLLEKLMTDPEQARTFIQKTGADTLAVALGTAHGYFKGREHIDFKRLMAIKKLVKVPIVLHGGSGVPDKQLKEGIKLGIRIVNIDTSLRLQFMSGLTHALLSYNPKRKVDLRPYLATARLTMQREASRLITLVGSARKA
jgi:ketose-bisphosphate aldolase